MFTALPRISQVSRIRAVAVLVGLVLAAALTPMTAVRASSSVLTAATPRHLLAKLSGASAGDQFGDAIAVSSTTAVIGADGAGSNAGAAYIYTRTSLGWNTTPTAVLHGVTAGDEFGVSVAISGATVAIGAQGRNSGTGAVYLYTETASGWETTPTAVFNGPHAQEQFGSAVALSKGGLLVGTGNYAAYLFAETSNGWNKAPTAVFYPVGCSFEGFGNAVALEGKYAVVGAPSTGTCSEAYIYTKASAGWNTAPTVILADKSTYSVFGAFLAMSGTTLVVGAVFQNNNNGAAFVFTRGAAGWATTPALAVHGDKGSELGKSVTILGGRVGVGAINNLYGNGVGAAYEFVKSQSGWDSKPALVLHSFVAGDDFGYSMALSTGTVFVGAPAFNPLSGAVYIFSS